MVRDVLSRYAIVAMSLSVATASACSLVARLDDDAFGDGDASAVSPDSDGGGREASSEGAAEGGCAAGFCDDFERASLQGTWDSISGTGLEILAAEGHGRVLAATLDASKPDGWLTKRFADRATTIRYAFDLQVASLPQGSMNVSGLDIDQGDGRSWQTFLLVVPGGMQLGMQTAGTDGGGIPYSGVAVTPPIPLREWRRMELRIELAGTPTVTLLVGGIEAAQQRLPASIAPGPFAVTAGVRYSDNATGAQILTDNIAVDESK